MRVPKSFHSMTKEDQQEYVAKRLLEARNHEKFWADLSRQIVYASITTIEMDRPDLELLKENENS